MVFLHVEFPSFVSISLAVLSLAAVIDVRIEKNKKTPNR